MITTAIIITNRVKFKKFSSKKIPNLMKIRINTIKIKITIIKKLKIIKIITTIIILITTIIMAITWKKISLIIFKKVRTKILIITIKENLVFKIKITLINL